MREIYFQVSLIIMSLNLETSIHQIGNTLAWSVLLNISLVAVNTRYHHLCLLLHSVLGWAILVLTYINILLLLVPNGLNIYAAGYGVLVFVHAILGLCMMAFVVLQVAGGVLIRLQLGNRDANLELLARVKKGHQFFGYFLAIVYKINVIWSWAGTWILVGVLIIWEICFIVLLFQRKIKKIHLKEVVSDRQTTSTDILKVQSTKQIENINKNYVIFQNYAYNAQNLAGVHPGGSRVIETVIGREVDRFLYGMYSSELLPALPLHSHSANCLKLVGPPFAQLFVQPTFQGFNGYIAEARISFVHVVSQKTQIYQLGLSLQKGKLIFSGYTVFQQLGQYYSLTADDKITRLYTAVNFLILGNVDLMRNIIPQLQAHDLFKNRMNPSNKMRQTQLSELQKGKGQLRQNLLQKNNEGSNQKDSFLPIMLKVYPTGKFTSMLKQRQFKLDNLRVSCAMGRGLELDSTPSGRIIVLAGGTGLFPFCDIIDLLFKANLITQDHSEKQLLLRQNPILQKHKFTQYSFTFLIALNELQDIHPITLHQLIYLSSHSKTTKVVMRVSKNPQQLQNVSPNHKIEFTKEYFNRRVINEAKNEGLARVWICGPPKMASDTAFGLLQNGIPRDGFLLL